MSKIDFLINPRVILSDLINPEMYKRAFTVITNTLLGKEMPLDTVDRRVLEKDIIPYFIQQEDFQKLLFVGCGSYTKHYEKWFQHKQEYWTIDINPFKKLYGAKRHIIDSSSNLTFYFPENSLDLIICNGVFGHGLDDKEEVEKAYGSCYQCLREGGVLIIGWDDAPSSKPFPLESCESINKFKPYFFSPLGTSLFVNPKDESDKHKYNFYMKK